MSNDSMPEFYCTKCEAKGIKTLLFYSNPKKETDTWTRRRANANDYRCNMCYTAESKLFSTKVGRGEHRRKTESIAEFHARRIKKFRELWQDASILDDEGKHAVQLSNPEHLMWIFIRRGIRNAQAGFTVDEMTEVIREGQIEYSPTDEASRYMKNMRERGIPLSVREMVESEVLRVYNDVREAMQAMRRRQYLNITRGEVDQANKIWDRKEADKIEKIVTTPGHRDPEGNAVQRYHLLSETETWLKREAKKRRQQGQIEKTINREHEITESVEKKIGGESSSTVS